MAFCGGYLRVDDTAVVLLFYCFYWRGEIVLGVPLLWNERDDESVAVANLKSCLITSSLF